DIATAPLLAIDTLYIGEFDDQPVRLDLDPGDPIVDEDRVLDLGGCFEVTPNRFCDEGLDLVCRDPADGSGLFGSALQQGGRDVVAVLDGSLSDMAWGHSMTAIIVDAAQ